MNTFSTNFKSITELHSTFKGKRKTSADLLEMYDPITRREANIENDIFIEQPQAKVFKKNLQIPATRLLLTRVSHGVPIIDTYQQ